jgi:O-antigen/teichoic acid export membrane protein
MGLVGGLFLLTLIPVVIGPLLQIPEALKNEARLVFTVSALSLPIITVGTSVIGLIQGLQRFEIAVKTELPMNTAHYLLPLLSCLFWPNLVFIVALLFFNRLSWMIVSFWLAVRTFPDIMKNKKSDRQEMLSLIRFGGWVWVSSLVSPIMVYGDRLLISNMISLSAVAYYAVPAEMAMRLLIIPFSLGTVLFPVFSNLAGKREWTIFREVLIKAFKFTLLIMGLITVVAIIFAQEILGIWIGEGFARQSAVVLQILVLGIMATSISTITFTNLQAIGRPDVTAKIHLLELPLQIGLTILFIKYWGLPGAAVAWSGRLIVEMGILFYFNQKKRGLSFNELVGERIPHLAVLLIILGIAGLLINPKIEDLLSKAVFFVMLLSVGITISWTLFFDGKDKDLIKQRIRYWEA